MKVFRRKLANFHQLLLADEKTPAIGNFHRPGGGSTEVMVVTSIGQWPMKVTAVTFVSYGRLMEIKDFCF
jgi:hypothetical protein